MSLEVFDLGATQPDISVVIEPLLREYEKRIRPHAGWLEEQGHNAAKLALAKALGSKKRPAGGGGAPGQPAPPAWVDRLLSPVIEPFGKGFKDEAIKLTKPYVVGGVVVIVASVGLAFFAGRAFGKRKLLDTTRVGS
ncbi:MAG: hypothetical protein AABY46_04480 [Nitrospirota bacterium]